ncbi:hypothetical protein [Bacillus sp. FJAT-47783]|nr:hypothetical protein [Bacillus sp. FJAT-47783]
MMNRHDHPKRKNSDPNRSQNIQQDPTPEKNETYGNKSHKN